jgi:hypothetical protein
MTLRHAQGDRASGDLFRLQPFELVPCAQVTRPIDEYDLFTAALVSPLVEAAERALASLRATTASFLEAHCLLDADLRPRRETLDEDAAEHVLERERLEAELAAAIAAVRRS